MSPEILARTPLAVAGLLAVILVVGLLWNGIVGALQNSRKRWQ